MKEIDSYTFYSLNSDIREDKIDKCVSELCRMNEYDDVYSFVKEFFGEFKDEKLFEYPELNKQVFINVSENTIEIFAAKNKKQFFSKGWKLVNDKREIDDERF